MPRKEERLTYLKEVDLEFSSGQRSARISDISPGGCYIDTIAQVPIGEPVRLEIGAVDGSSMVFTGKVAYILDGFGFGVEFIELSDEHKDFLSRLIGSASG